MSSFVKNITNISESSSSSGFSSASAMSDWSKDGDMPYFRQITPRLDSESWLKRVGGWIASWF